LADLLNELYLSGVVDGDEKSPGTAIAEQPSSTTAIVYSVTDKVVAEFKRDFLSLKISGIGDKSWLEKVRSCRMKCVNARTSIEKTKLKMTEESREYVKRVNAEAKRLTELLATVAKEQTDRQAAIDAENDRLEQIRKDQEAAQERIDAENKRIADEAAELDRKKNAILMAPVKLVSTPAAGGMPTAFPNQVGDFALDLDIDLSPSGSVPAIETRQQAAMRKDREAVAAFADQIADLPIPEIYVASRSVLVQIRQSIERSAAEIRTIAAGIK
jgi:hypothetical protein